LTFENGLGFSTRSLLKQLQTRTYPRRGLNLKDYQRTTSLVI